MSCNSCGSAGSCGCASVTIPHGADGNDGADGVGVTVVAEPAGANCLYGGVKITDGAGIVSYVCTGSPGADGNNATPIGKYANTFTVTSAVVLGVTIYSPIIITGAVIATCNPLTSTCVSTPTNLDFNITIWYNTGGSQWLDVTSNTTYISQIIYDTAADLCTIICYHTGSYRVVIVG